MKNISIEAAIATVQAPKNIGILGFALVEEDVGVDASCSSIRLNVQVHLPRAQGQARQPPTVLAQGWVDSESLPTADVKQCTWRSVELWDTFWAACRDRVQPHLQPHRFPRYSNSKRPPQPREDTGIQGTEVWSVYEIVDFKMSYGRPSFNVSWVDYPDADNTWEPLRSLKQPLHTFNWSRLGPWLQCCKFMSAGKPHLLPQLQEGHATRVQMREVSVEEEREEEEERPLPPPRVRVRVCVFVCQCV